MENEEIKELLEFMVACNVIDYEKRVGSNNVNFNETIEENLGRFYWGGTPQGDEYWLNISEDRHWENDYTKFID